MPKRKVTPQQIVAALHRVELALAQGAPARTAIKNAGISSAAYYRWRDEYGGMNTQQVQRLLELKKENARLRGLLDRLSRVTIWRPTAAGFDHHGPGQRGAPEPTRDRRPARAKGSTEA
jgi:hypothetical protein